MRGLFFCFLASILVVSLVVPALAQEPGFTREDRERLIRLEATLTTFMHQVDKRFEQVDKRFEQVDKRFEQVDKRFEQLMTFLWMLVGIFTSLVVAVIGFAYWDRRTIIRKAKEETMDAIEREGRLVHLIHALRELAKEDEKLAGVLRTFGFL